MTLKDKLQTSLDLPGRTRRIVDCSVNGSCATPDPSASSQWVDSRQPEVGPVSVSRPTLPKHSEGLQLEPGRVNVTIRVSCVQDRLAVSSRNQVRAVDVRSTLE